MKPTLYFLIGIPGSGKSTWIKNQNITAVIASTDDYIEKVAAEKGTSYDTEFPTSIKSATAEMYQSVSSAIKSCSNVIWDQTSTSKTSRKKKIKMFPDSYHKVAVFFHCPPDDILLQRLLSRPGKTIPQHVINSMKSQLEFPSLDEGFDEIIEVKNF